MKGEVIMTPTKQTIQKVKDQNCYLFIKDIYSEEDLRELVGIASDGISVDWRHVVYYAFNNFTKFRQCFLREARIKAINELISNNHTKEESTKIIDIEIQSHIHFFLLPPNRRHNKRELNMIMERHNYGDFIEFKFKDDLFYICLENILSTIERY